MGVATLHIDLGALSANWRALDAMTDCETGAVVKADGYGLGAGRVARALAQSGCKRFFVAVAEEGAGLREALGPDPQIFVFSGHMPGDTDMIADLSLTPLLNSLEQATRHFEALPGHGFGLQLDTGMNRLGLEETEWMAARDILLGQGPELIVSHLACADEPDTSMNAQQLAAFLRMTDGLDVPRSLAATGGILLGPEYHFDLTRPGIGLFGGLPFAEAAPVARLSLPVIQTRDLAPGEHVGYGCTWTADEPAAIATVSGGYADGLIRAMGNEAMMFFEGTPCPVIGRVSMDLITVDVTHLPATPTEIDILCPEQTVDDLAGAAGTIGYEILTGLGARYRRRYSSGQG